MGLDKVREDMPERNFLHVRQAERQEASRWHAAASPEQMTTAARSTATKSASMACLSARCGWSTLKTRGRASRRRPSRNLTPRYCWWRSPSLSRSQKKGGLARPWDTARHDQDPARGLGVRGPAMARSQPWGGDNLGRVDRATLRGRHEGTLRGVQRLRPPSDALRRGRRPPGARHGAAVAQ
jgi:hypothetical protein